MRFAHISDLHFGSVDFNPLQLFSKRWIGNLNYILARKSEFAYPHLDQLAPLFKENNVTHIFITGDLTVTSQKKEFKRAQEFVKNFEREGFEVFAIPGNHDHYTRNSYKKRRFYDYFADRFHPECPFNLKEHKVTYRHLGNNFSLVALDTSVATSLFSAQGYFSPEIEENLIHVLKEIPQNHQIILINHFPFFQNDAPKKELVRGPILKKLLEESPNVLLYLHGHTHRQIVADLRASTLPIILDSGCCPHMKQGTCHLFEIKNKRIDLDVYHFAEGWKKRETHEFKTLV